MNIKSTDAAQQLAQALLLKKQKKSKR